MLITCVIYKDGIYNGREEGKIGVPGKNPRSMSDQLRELYSPVKYHTGFGFSGERHNALTTLVTQYYKITQLVKNKLT